MTHKLLKKMEERLTEEQLDFLDDLFVRREKEIEHNKENSFYIITETDIDHNINYEIRTMGLTRSSLDFFYDSFQTGEHETLTLYDGSEIFRTNESADRMDYAGFQPLANLETMRFFDILKKLGES